MKLRNTNPLGQVDVPLLGRQGDPFGETGRGCLEPGEEFDVTADQARQLLPQGDNFAPADAEAQAVVDELLYADFGTERAPAGHSVQTGLRAADDEAEDA